MAKTDKKEQRRAPILRFKGFTDDWEQRELGEISYIKGRIGWKSLKQSEYVEKGPALIASKHISNGKINWTSVDHIPDWRYEESPEIMLELNDIIFSKDGSIGNPAVITLLPNKATINSTMMLVRLDKNILSAGFFYQILVSNQFKKLVFEKTSGSSIPHIFQNDMKKFKFYFPQQGEQIKISNMLNILDNLIALYERKVKLLLQIKKYLLDNLFTEKDYPKLRFKGFTEAWEQRKLGEMITERKILRFDSKEFPLSSFIKNEGVVPKSSRYDRSFLVKSNSKKYKETRLGDFIYSSNNLDTGSIGLNNYGNAVISPVYSVFTSKDTENLETSFINLLFKKNFYRNKMLRFRQGVTYGQWKIKENDFLNLKVYTSNSTEIEKIIAIFSKISQCITLYENKQKQLAQIKNNLLNTMFI